MNQLISGDERLEPDVKLGLRGDGTFEVGDLLERDDGSKCRRQGPES